MKPAHARGVASLQKLIALAATLVLLASCAPQSTSNDDQGGGEDPLAQAETPTFNPEAGTYEADASVTLSTSTPGGTIHYTTDGSEPTTASEEFDQASPIPVSGDGTNVTIRAIADAPNFAPSPIASATYTINYPVAATPVFDPAGGTYATDQTVSITTSTPAATIYYTTDGSEPTDQSNVFDASSPIVVAGDGTSTTIKAIAVAAGYKSSPVVEASFDIDAAPAEQPTFDPEGGEYTGDIDIALSTPTSGATIYYTTDGSEPTPGSAVYEEGSPISVSGDGTSVTIRAIADAPNFAPSPIASATYIIQYPVAATPVFDPVGDTYTTDQTVSITTSTPGATIHYTTDGSEPDTSSTVFTEGSPIAVSGSDTSMTIRAIAVADGFAPSNVATANYTIEWPPAASPQFSQPSGTYTTPFDLEITSPDGGTIYYTTDGSTPDDSSTEYTAAIPIAAPIDVTVRAIVYPNATDELSPSDVSSVSYSDGIITVTNGNLSGPGSLDRAILEANPGDTIVFDGSYTITQAGVNPTAPQWFVIDKDLTIDAEDNTITLDANRRGRHFNVKNGAIVSLLGTNLTLSDGASLSYPSKDSKAGGSIFVNQGAELVVDGVTVRDNTTLTAEAPNQTGAASGAIHVSGGSVTIRNAHFSNNESEKWGGAIGMANGPSSSVHITDSTFENNVAALATGSGNFGGGAINVSGTGAVEVYNSTFIGNQAGAAGLEREGGAIRNAGSLIVSSSTFTRNVADGDGGAIFSRKSGSVTRIYNSSFNGNNASQLGAAVAAIGGDLLIVSSAFAGNLGTAVHADAGTNTIVNATFAANQDASVSGVEFSSGTNELANSAFDATANPTSGTFTSHNNIGPGGFSDADSIDGDPFFVSPPAAGGDGTWGTSDDDYGDLSLQTSSAAIDSGDSARLPADTDDVDGDDDTTEAIPTDRAGNTRDVGTAVDMGAYESQ